MTDQQLIDYYASLLILQYLQQPKAFAHIQTLVTPVIMDQLILQVQDAFNLVPALGPVAEGVQLDVLGKYVGVTRVGNTFTGPIVLDDTDFSILIQLAIFTNNAGSSLATIQQLISIFFPGQILVFDFKDMRLGYFLSIGSKNLVEMIILQGKLPKPMAVQLSSVIYAPVINRFFGFQTYELPPVNNTPFNTYASYDMNSPWLTYADALVV